LLARFGRPLAPGCRGRSPSAAGRWGAADLSHLCNGGSADATPRPTPPTFFLYKNLNDAIGAGLGWSQALQSECKVNTAHLLKQVSCIRLVFAWLLCIKR